MSKSQLEKVLEHLINEDVDAAEGLLHDFILAKARQIHKELMEDEDELDEPLEDEESEEGDEDADGEKDEESDEDESEEASDDIEDEIEDKDEDGEKSVEELSMEVADLQADLSKLQAEFEQLMDVESKEEEHKDDPEFQAIEDEVSKDESEDSDEEEEDDFEFESFDLDESFELEPVKANIKSGSTIGAGSSVAQNTKSPIPQEKFGDRAMKGKPVTIDSKDHDGFEKEQSPSVKDPVVKARNNSGPKLSKVSREGDSSAKLNKTESEFGGPNTKSPIGSK